MSRPRPHRVALRLVSGTIVPWTQHETPHNARRARDNAVREIEANGGHEPGYERRQVHAVILAVLHPGGHRVVEEIKVKHNRKEPTVATSTAKKTTSTNRSRSSKPPAAAAPAVEQLPAKDQIASPDKLVSDLISAVKKAIPGTEVVEPKKATSGYKRLRANGRTLAYVNIGKRSVRVNAKGPKGKAGIVVSGPTEIKDVVERAKAAATATS